MAHKTIGQIMDQQIFSICCRNGDQNPAVHCLSNTSIIQKTISVVQSKICSTKEATVLATTVDNTQPSCLQNRITQWQFAICFRSSCTKLNIFQYYKHLKGKKCTQQWSDLSLGYERVCTNNVKSCNTHNTSWIIHAIQFEHFARYWYCWVDLSYSKRNQFP